MANRGKYSSCQQQRDKFMIDNDNHTKLFKISHSFNQDIFFMFSTIKFKSLTTFAKSGKDPLHSTNRWNGKAYGAQPFSPFFPYFASFFLSLFYPIHTPHALSGQLKHHLFLSLTHTLSLSLRVYVCVCVLHTRFKDMIFFYFMFS